MSVSLLLRALAVAVAAMVLNLLAAFAWVWIYSLAVAPGHDAAFYQSHARVAGPICDILFGIPLLFGAGWLIARHAGWRAGAIIGMFYVLIDLAALVSTTQQGLAGAWPLALVSYLTKMAAAALGGFLGRQGWESRGA
jgi:hypothetical protein